MSVQIPLPRIAVVGAASLIGDALLNVLRAVKFPHTSLTALDEDRSLGRSVADEAGDAQDLKIGDVARFDFGDADLVFFCGRGALAERYAEGAAERAWVIDLSSTFRARADVPLVVADVNADSLRGFGRRGLIALPGSGSVALATALAPLESLC